MSTQLAPQEIERFQALVQKFLSPKRFRHVQSTIETAADLAFQHRVDTDKAKFSALSHDLFRQLNDRQLLAMAKYYDLAYGEEEAGRPVLLHGPLAAVYLKRKLCIDDDDIFEAVAFHTTGKMGMGSLAKILYIADAVEPTRDYPQREYFLQQAYMDLDKACLLILSDQQNYFPAKGYSLHPLSLLWLAELKEAYTQKDGTNN